jgi:hypothetical protein
MVALCVVGAHACVVSVHVVTRQLTCGVSARVDVASAFAVGRLASLRAAQRLPSTEFSCDCERFDSILVVAPPTTARKNCSCTATRQRHNERRSDNDRSMRQERERENNGSRRPGQRTLRRARKNSADQLRAECRMNEFEGA